MFRSGSILRSLSVSSGGYCGKFLDMEVISDTFTPTVPSMMDHIWGFFSGFRQRGVQSTEKMLREGTLMTGIGEIVCEQDGSFKLQPPSNGGLYYLTTLPVSSLLKKLESSKKNYGLLTLVCTAIGVVLAGMILRKYLKQRKLLKDEEERRSLRDKTRKINRRSTRNTDNLTENQICVVCKSNPIEVSLNLLYCSGSYKFCIFFQMILLPCGHVCLCEDCAEDITSHCPICRAAIELKSPAYVV